MVAHILNKQYKLNEMQQSTGYRIAHQVNCVMPSNYAIRGKNTNMVETNTYLHYVSKSIVDNNSRNLDLFLNTNILIFKGTLNFYWVQLTKQRPNLTLNYQFKLPKTILIQISKTKPNQKNYSKQKPILTEIPLLKPPKHLSKLMHNSCIFPNFLFII